MQSTDPFASFEVTGPEMTAWEREQTSKATEYLHHLPNFDEVLRRVRHYRETPPTEQVELRGNVTFSLEAATASSGMAILRREGKSAPKVVFAFGEDDAAQRKQIDFMAVSHSGRFIAIGTSEAGTEETTVRVLDGRTGKDLGDRSYNVELEWVKWLPDDSGYLYMREQRAKDTPLQDRHRNVSAALHMLGKPAEQDVEIIGANAPGARALGEYEFPYAVVSPDGRDVFVGVGHGVNPDLTVLWKARNALSNGKSTWERLYEEHDHVRFVAADNGRVLAARSVEDHYVLEETVVGSRRARRVLYTSKFPLETVLTAGKDTYVVETDLATKHLVVVRNGSASPVAQPEGTSIWPESLRVDPLTHRVAIDLRSWTEPRTWWTVAQGKRSTEPLIAVPSALRTDAFEVRVIEATARDGERIPLTVVRPKNQGNGAPKFVWVNAYGSYGIVIGPNFNVPRRTFLELGGTYVFAHVRGGGEKGERWHNAARGPNKIKTVEDFIDAVKFLRAEGYGKDGGIVASGVSAGAIPAGGLLVREPELVDGVFIDIGVGNVSRMEAASAVGVLHKEEFGTNDTPEGARKLREIDAYLNVQDGRAYPATLLRTGVNDARAPRWQSTKLAARLQQATTGTKPILLRLTGGGHALGGTPEEAATTDAELVTFVLTSTKHPSFR